MCAQLLSHVWLFAATQTVACQAPLPMEFSRQGYWSGLPFPSPYIKCVCVCVYFKNTGPYWDILYLTFQSWRGGWSSNLIVTYFWYLWESLIILSTWFKINELKSAFNPKTRARLVDGPEYWPPRLPQHLALPALIMTLVQNAELTSVVIIYLSRHRTLFLMKGRSS